MIDTKSLEFRTAFVYDVIRHACKEYNGGEDVTVSEDDCKYILNKLFPHPSQGAYEAYDFWKDAVSDSEVLCDEDFEEAVIDLGLI